MTTFDDVSIQTICHKFIVCKAAVEGPCVGDFAYVKTAAPC